MAAPGLLLLLPFLHVLLMAALAGGAGSPSESAAAPLNDDVLGLIVFKSGLVDPAGELSSWQEDDDTPCATWAGVQCDPATARVSAVSLDGLGLSGRITRGLEKLPSLESLSLSGNNFSGLLPAHLALLPVLRRLNLSGNAFSGPLPPELAALPPTLRALDLSGNALDGPMDGQLFSGGGLCASLRYLSLASNYLSGPIPASISRCGFLLQLSLSGNRLSGEPDFVGGLLPLRRLRVLDLSRNDLSGPVPEGIGNLHNLKALYLNGNRFSGPVPAGLGLCPHLAELDLSGNSFSGALPGPLQWLSSLSYLNISGNQLSGDLPWWVSNMTALERLDLSRNKLTGSLPPALGDLRDLRVLSLSSNAISGGIPETVGQCGKLAEVSLRGNAINGSIPQGLFEVGLEELDLSDNGLTGAIPPGSTRLFETLRQLDLSRHRRFLSVSAIVAISAALVIVLGVLVVTLLNASARRRIGLVETALESMCSSSTSRSGDPAVGKLVLFGPRSDLWSEDLSGGAEALLHKATEIGRGAFGTVYKASVGSGGEAGGKIVAVKKLLTSNIVQYHDDFDREVRTLGKARHPNLMPLKGYYWTPQVQLLIFDYSTGSSLHARLHESSHEAPMSWAARFKIALGTAKGLAHLHQSFRPPIIHYNIKPSNILLDEAGNPRVTDFGLARLLPRPDRHAVSSRFQSALGYVAPEMACQSLRVNERCDVYGFGVVVLELVTGRRPVEYGEDDVVILVDQVRAMLERGTALDCVDPRMGPFPDEEVLPVLKLGLVCTSQIPSSRPSMAEVVQILQVIKTPVPEKMEAF
ncbi:hypothetical protein Taro_019688 [Colocasia esculenta]|uniref:non-specific serine/threonine protein kinase n=1 Tax=Colocasia esculenta TaxID=4460 RepID=A0A843UZX3_COLES|nr:hypothetical protein [Colocasia esculenta]